MRLETGTNKLFFSDTKTQRFAAGRQTVRNAFTLIEVLVAMVIMLMVVSMVYGSYFATSRSAEVYKSIMNSEKDARQTLQRMASQIRGAYLAEHQSTKTADKVIPEDAQQTKQTTPGSFLSNPDDPEGRLLRFVTTTRLFAEDNKASELIDVVYLFDPGVKTIYLSQRRFVPNSLVEKRNYRPILTDVKRIQLQFHDGQKWNQKWNSGEKNDLPHAIKIEIERQDQRGRLTSNQKIVNLPCCKSTVVTVEDLNISNDM